MKTSGMCNLLNRITIVAVFFLIFSITIPQSSDAGQDAIIKGTAKFLMDRANAIVLDRYIHKIINNELFDEYFPTTKQYLVNNDTALYNLAYDNTFKIKLEDDLIDAIKKHIKTLDDTLISKDESKIYEKLKSYIDIETSKKILKKIPAEALDFYYKEKKLTKSNKIEGLAAFFQESPDEKGQFFKQYQKIVITIFKEKKDDLLNCIKIKDKSYINLVNITLEIIAVIDKEKNFSTTTKFKKLKEYALFLAKLADAKDEDAVEYILNSTTLSVNSYKSKRNDDKWSIFVTAYLGLTAGYESWVQDNDKNKYYDFKDNKHYYYGIFAPIGLELTRCSFWEDRSFSLFLSIFDLGNVINTEYWHKEKVTYSFASITAPGIYAVLGLNDSPFVFGVGAQYANVYRENEVSDTQTREWKYSVFFAIDIPLFNL